MLRGAPLRGLRRILKSVSSGPVKAHGRRVARQRQAALSERFKSIIPKQSAANEKRVHLRPGPGSWPAAGAQQRSAVQADQTIRPRQASRRKRTEESCSTHLPPRRGSWLASGAAATRRCRTPSARRRCGRRRARCRAATPGRTAATAARCAPACRQCQRRRRLRRHQQRTGAVKSSAARGRRRLPPQWPGRPPAGSAAPAAPPLHPPSPDAAGPAGKKVTRKCS